MKKLGRTLCLALIFALILSASCMAEHSTPEYDFSDKTIDQIMDEFMAQHGLTEKNFSMGWYDTGSGESWFFNADLYMPAGSMYKLPLNMELERQLDSGELMPDELIGGYAVDRAMYMSIVESNNEVSQILRGHLSSDRDTYRRILNQYSGIPESELPPGYYSDNHMSPRFVLNTLKYLYDNMDAYDTVTELMKQAHPGAYFRKYQGEYEIAHKYGSFEGMLNDCGIVFTPTPFLLVAFTRSVPDNSHVLGALCEMLSEYSLYRDEQAEKAAEEAARLAAEEAERLAQEQARLEAEEAARQELAAQQEQAQSELPEAPMQEEPPAEDGTWRIAVTAGAAALFLILGAVLMKTKKKEQSGKQ